MQISGCIVEPVVVMTASPLRLTVGENGGLPSECTCAVKHFRRPELDMPSSKESNLALQ